MVTAALNMMRPMTRTLKPSPQHFFGFFVEMMGVLSSGYEVIKRFVKRAYHFDPRYDQEKFL